MVEATGGAGGRAVDWGAALETIRDPKTSEADAKGLLQKLAADLFRGLDGSTTALDTTQSDGGPRLPPGGGGTNDLSRLTGLLGISQTGAANVQGIAQLVMQLNLESRKAERMERQQLRDLDVQTQLQAADKIRSQAAFAFAATMITSAMSIAGAVSGIKGALKSQSIRTEGFAQAKALEQPKLPGTTSSFTPGTTPTTAPTRAPMIGTTRPGMAAAKLPDLETTSTAQPRNPVVSPGGPKVSGAPDAGKTAPTPRSADGLTPDQIRENALKEATDIDRIWSLRGQIETESGKAIGAMLQYGAAEQEAQKAELEAKATAIRSKAEDATDFIRAYEDNIRNVISKLDAIQQSEAEMNRQIVRA